MLDHGGPKRRHADLPYLTDYLQDYPGRSQWFCHSQQQDCYHGLQFGFKRLNADRRGGRSQVFLSDVNVGSLYENVQIYNHDAHFCDPTVRNSHLPFTSKCLCQLSVCMGHCHGIWWFIISGLIRRVCLVWTQNSNFVVHSSSSMHRLFSNNVPLYTSTCLPTPSACVCSLWRVPCSVWI